MKSYLTNRYIPPEYDPKQASTLNAHQGKKHALGKRAKDIDKGILIVRYVQTALPFVSRIAFLSSELMPQIRITLQHLVRDLQCESIILSSPPSQPDCIGSYRCWSSI